MIAAVIRWSARNVAPRADRRRSSSSLAGLYAVSRVPLDAIPDLSDVQVIVYTEYPGTGAAGGRGPGHLPADHGHAERAEVDGGARLLVLRRVLRLRHLRGRHRHLLGALARPRIPELRAARRLPDGVVRRALARTRRASAGSINTPCAGENRTLAELRSHAGLVRSATGWRRRTASPRSPASAASSRQYSVIDRSAPAAGARHPARPRRRGDQAEQPRRRRPHHRNGGDGVRRPRPRLSAGIADIEQIVLKIGRR